MNKTTKTAPICDLCEGSLLVSRGTQAGSACACHPCWAEHRVEREADIRRGMGGFTGRNEDHLTDDRW